MVIMISGSYMAGNVPWNAKWAQWIQALTAIVNNLANAITGNQGAPHVGLAEAAVAFSTSLCVATVEEMDYPMKHGDSL